METDRPRRATQGALERPWGPIRREISGHDPRGGLVPAIVSDTHSAPRECDCRLPWYQGCVTVTELVRPRLSLFAGFGIELEYMIVDASTLSVRPICDVLLKDVAGTQVADIDFETISWSNELALHVVELKTNGPAPSLDGLAAAFQDHVGRVNAALQPHHACLLPTAMHPWMNPDQELRLWPHDYSPVYEAFNRIFDCRGHGWANLQSMHINLPFANDEEFGRLHAAIRLILPLLPGLAASSPFKDGQATALMDTRLDVYRGNARRVPEVSGLVIPERAFTEAEYDRQIFQPLYAAIRPLDVDGILQEEFLNARGAIARFGRGSIEIRVIDVQECPAADLAIAEIVVRVLQSLVEERWSSFHEQQLMESQPLAEILADTIRSGSAAKFCSPELSRILGVVESGTVRDLWYNLASAVGVDNAWLEIYRQQGTLAERILSTPSKTPTNIDLPMIYRRLATALSSGSVYAL